MDQENLPEHSQLKDGKAAELPGAPRLGSKLLPVVSVIGVAAGLVVLLAVTHLPVIRSPWAGLVDKPQSLIPSFASPVRRTALAAPVASENLPPAAPSQNATFSPEEQTEKIWADFEKTRLGDSLDDWSKQHPEISCRRFNGTMWSPTADAAWSERCSAGARSEDPHWFFYSFGLEEPPISRLEQFDISTLSLPTESLTAVSESLRRRLATRFGPGEDARPKFGRLREPAWPPNLRWQTAEVEIQLFQSELDPQRNTSRMRLQVRSRALLDALKEDERLKQFDQGGYLYEPGGNIDSELAERLRAEFPDSAAKLTKQRPDSDPQIVAKALEQWKQQFKASQAAGQSGARAAVIAIPQANWKAAEFEDSILRLLNAAKTAAPERQPMFLLAADRLAGRLPSVMTNDNTDASRWAEWRQQLAKFGVVYDASSGEDGNSWRYTGSLLKLVWNEYPRTEWGERAFMLLLNQGFDIDIGIDCAAGSDQFRAVISQGLQFLETHPNSPFRLDVQVAVAQAYETFWSLSQAPPDQEYSAVEAAPYQDGAPAARQKAIATYEAILQSLPQTDHAAYARRHLPRLKLGVDTGQRRFYCEAGD